MCEYEGEVLRTSETLKVVWWNNDLLALAPGFGRRKADERIRLLWRIRQYADSRIEPVAVGVREFEEDDGSPPIGIARRDGFVVSLPAAAMVHEVQEDYGMDSRKK